MQFSKTFIVLLSLLVLVPSTECEYKCFKIFEPTVESASEEFECTHCCIHIHPSPDRALRLTVSTKSSRVEVTWSRMGTRFWRLKDLVPSHSTKTMIFEPKEGAKMELNENLCDPYSQTTFSFTRFDPRSMLEKNVSNDNHSIESSSSALLTEHRYASDGRFSEVLDVLSEVLDITAYKSCACPDKNIDLKFHEPVVLKSPGCLCPYANCSTRLTIPPIADYTLPENHISRIFFSVAAVSYDDVYLTVKSGETSLRFDSSTHSHIEILTKMIMNENDLSVQYTTPYGLRASFRGHFKIMAKRIAIHRDCDCSVFPESIYQGEFQFEVEVPSHCQIMSCYWPIMPLWDQTSELEVELRNGDRFDEIHFISNRIMKKYRNYNLPLKIEQKNEDWLTHVIFWRTGGSTNATLRVTRKMKDGDGKQFEAPKYQYRGSKLTSDNSSTAVLTTTADRYTEFF